MNRRYGSFKYCKTVWTRLKLTEIDINCSYVAHKMSLSTLVCSYRVHSLSHMFHHSGKDTFCCSLLQMSQKSKLLIKTDEININIKKGFPPTKQNILYAGFSRVRLPAGKHLLRQATLQWRKLATVYLEYQNDWRQQIWQTFLNFMAGYFPGQERVLWQPWIVNPFTPRSDQYVVFLYIIKTLSTRQVMRIKKIIN